MAARDLTRQFVERRRFSKISRTHMSENNPYFSSKKIDHNDQQTVPLIAHDYNSDIAMPPKIRHELPPLWVEQVESVNADLRYINTQMELLTQLHRSRLMVRFDNSEDFQDAEIDELTVAITARFRSAEKALKNISSAGVGNSTYLSVADRNLRRNIQQSLATKLQQLSSVFRRSQQDYLNKVTKQKKGGDFSDFDVFDTSKSGSKIADNSASNSSATQESCYSLVDQEIVDAAELMVEERDQELQRILRSIHELSSIFQELSALVIDQGTVLDRVDYNMEMVVSRMALGLRELRKADRYQKNSRPIRCMALLATGIVMCTVALVMKHT